MFNSFKYLLIGPMTIIIWVWVANYHFRVYLASVMVELPLWDMDKSLSYTHKQDTCKRP